jgi:hypothetical protein
VDSVAMRRRRWLWWAAVVPIVVLAVALTAFRQPLFDLVREPLPPETYYACLRDGRFTRISRQPPRRCPPGAAVVTWEQSQEGATYPALRWITGVLRTYLTVRGVMLSYAIATVAWLIAGRSLRTWAALRWHMVPVLLLLAAICIAGPGRWFPKDPWEGPSVIPLSRKDAITVLDLIGILIGACAAYMAVTQLGERWFRGRHRGRSTPGASVSRADERPAKRVSGRYP